MARNSCIRQFGSLCLVVSILFVSLSDQSGFEDDGAEPAIMQQPELLSSSKALNAKRLSSVDSSKYRSNGMFGKKNDDVASNLIDDENVLVAKKNKWESAKGLWGKRASWQKASGLWGKRSAFGWKRSKFHAPESAADNSVWGSKRGNSNWKNANGLWG